MVILSDTLYNFLTVLESRTGEWGMLLVTKGELKALRRMDFVFKQETGVTLGDWLETFS